MNEHLTIDEYLRQEVKNEICLPTQNFLDVLEIL